MMWCDAIRCFGLLWYGLCMVEWMSCDSRYSSTGCDLEQHHTHLQYFEIIILYVYCLTTYCTLRLVGMMSLGSSHAATGWCLGYCWPLRRGPHQTARRGRGKASNGVWNDILTKIQSKTPCILNMREASRWWNVCNWELCRFVDSE